MGWSLKAILSEPVRPEKTYLGGGASKGHINCLKILRGWFVVPGSSSWNG